MGIAFESVIIIILYNYIENEMLTHESRTNLCMQSLLSLERDILAGHAHTTVLCEERQIWLQLPLFFWHGLATCTPGVIDDRCMRSTSIFISGIE